MSGTRVFALWAPKEGSKAVSTGKASLDLPVTIPPGSTCAIMARQHKQNANEPDFDLVVFPPDEQRKPAPAGSNPFAPQTATPPPITDDVAF